MADDSEWLKLPADEKCAHKNWKARLAGYEESTKLFNTETDPKSAEYSKYLGLLKKFVTDSNAVAQEKGLDATLAFVGNAHIAGKTAAEVCSGVIAKCLNSSRTKTREKGIEILMLYIEIEKQEIVQEELLKGLSNKQPKVVAMCVQVIRTSLKEFGKAIILIKPLVKVIQKLLEDRDKGVREEAKLLVVEIFRWIGPVLKPALTGLKPVQLTELEAEFENIPTGKAQQTRFLRSQQHLKAKIEAEVEAGGEPVQEDDVEQETEIDPFELMTAVNILGNLPKDFYTQVEEKKWQDRKLVLESVQKLTENPKLENDDYYDLVKALKKVVAKDANVMLVIIAAKCLTGLSKGMRQNFGVHAVGVVETIIEKFKEKKANVVAALREAIDAAAPHTSLESVGELIVAGVENKNPSIRAETAQFCARCLTRATMQTLPKKLLKLFCAALLKTVNDTFPECREASFAALGTALKVVGDKPMMPFLTEVDSIKMSKIKECAEKAELVGKPGKTVGKQVIKEVVTAEPVKEPKGKAKKPVVRSTKSTTEKKTTRKKDVKTAATEEEKVEQSISDEVAEEKATELLSAKLLNDLGSTNWKDRLVSTQNFAAIVETMSRNEIPCQVFVITVCKKPGLRDNNFQTLKLKVQLITKLAKASMFSRCSASLCLPDLIDKFGDVKCGSNVHECLTAIAEACSLEWTSKQVVEAAFAQKNPKNQSESLLWLANAIKEFGLKVNVKPMIGTIKKALQATNPAVRTSSIALCGVVYMYMGTTLRTLLEDEKPALLAQIDAEFEKVKDVKPPAPIRRVKAEESVAAENDSEEDVAEESLNVADLVPRSDVSDQLTDELMNEMVDKSWKVRGEALTKVLSIINEAKFIKPNIASLPENLRLRLADSNKILVTNTLNICKSLASAMGPKIRQHVRVVGPGIIQTMGDSKLQIREAAKLTMNDWLEQGGMREWVEADCFVEALRIENPNLRTTLLGWLKEKLLHQKKLPAELNGCIPLLFGCLEDRNPDVRKNAQESILPFMIHCGYETMSKMSGKLKPSGKEIVMALLDKERQNLPAKPTKSVTTESSAVAATKKPISSKTEDELESATKTVNKNKGRSSILGKKATVTASSSNKKKVEEDVSPLMKTNNAKELRFKDERNSKVLKWNFSSPRSEFIEQLKSQMEPNFNQTMMEQLFHIDFKKHITAIETLNKSCSSMYEETAANLDLLLKWFTLRFFDTNTSVLLKVLDYLESIFKMLIQEGYRLQEQEAQSFFPYLINKIGDPKDQVRKNIRSLLKNILQVYPASKLFPYLMDGLKSKNSKQRAECLEESGQMFEAYGTAVCAMSLGPSLKLIAGQIGDRDNSVRSAALNAIVAVHYQLGEALYKHIGTLNEKEMSMLEERIKRSARRTGPAIVKPPAEDKGKVVSGRASAAARMSPVRDTAFAEKNSEYIVAPEHPTKQNRKYFDVEVENLKPFSVSVPEFVPIPVFPSHEVTIPSSWSNSPGSPFTKILSSNYDVKSAIDLVVSQVASNEIMTATQAIAQIDEVLKDKKKHEILESHVDQLLIVCTLQLRMNYGKQISDPICIRLYKCLVAVIRAIFESALARKATTKVLKDLQAALISVLVDKRLEEMEEGVLLERAINTLLVKMLKSSEPTQIVSASILLLNESVDNDTCSAKYLEAVLKCILKLKLELPKFVNELNISVVLGDMNQFLVSFYSKARSNPENDMPLRIIKTLLYHLTKLKGNELLQYLDEVHAHSSLDLYVRKVLKSVDAPELPDMVKRSTSSDSSKSSASSTTDLLTDIFRKIGSKDITKEGLNELYDFQQNHSQTELEPFMKKTSQFFRSYIKRGLRNIELERQAELKVQNPSSLKVSTKSWMEMYEICQNQNPVYKYKDSMTTSELMEACTEEQKFQKQHQDFIDATYQYFGYDKPELTSPTDKASYKLETEADVDAFVAENQQIYEHYRKFINDMKQKIEGADGSASEKPVIENVAIESSLNDTELLIKTCGKFESCLPNPKENTASFDVSDIQKRLAKIKSNMAVRLDDEV